MPVDSRPIEHANSPLRQLYLLYHELRPSASAYSYVTGDDLFRRHVNLYASLVAAASPVVPVITFDDGHESDFTLAFPILAARNLKAHFFITAGWTSARRGYMDWSQIRELQQAGHTIGAHGWSHVFLTRCTPAQLDIELSRARVILEDRLGVAITTMSLPGGRFNRRVLESCSGAGYTHVFTSSPRSESAPLGFTVGRLNIRGDMQADWIARLLAPGSPLLTRVLFKHRVKVAAQSVLGDRLYARLWARANRHEAAPGFEEQSGAAAAVPASRQEPRS